MRRWPGAELGPKVPVYEVTDGFQRMLVEDTGKVSDGYHSFEELYAHRTALWITLCKSVSWIPRYAPWRSRRHSDGTELLGWFVLGIGTRPGEQMTYHLPDSCWDRCDFAGTLDRAPEFDGHTPADVLERIGRI